MRIASGTVQIHFAPCFRADPGTLRCAFVSVKASLGKMKFHAGIRSRAREREKKDAALKGRLYISQNLGEVDFGFGFDDEEGVGGRVAGGVEFLESVFEGVGEDGEEDAAVDAADEIEAAFGLDEL